MLAAYIISPVKDKQVSLEVTFSRDSFSEYRKKFALAFRAGKAEDIHSEDQDIIPELASYEQILPLDDLFTTWPRELREDFFPAVWDTVTWQGKVYAIPIESVVNAIFFRKDILRNLGYSDQEIGAMLPTNARNVTLDLLVELARKAKQKGMVEYGFLHRPNAGPYFAVMLDVFGARFVDPKTGQLIVDVPALQKMLQWHYDMVKEGLIPKDMTSWPWKTIHKYAVEGKTLFWIGGHSGQWKEWQDQPYHEKLGTLSEDYLEQNMGIMAFPGPTTLISTHGYMLVSTTKYPELSFDIITEAVRPELLARHAITTFRAPVRRSVLNTKEFKNERFLGRVTQIVEVGKGFPKHPEFSRYMDLVCQAVAGVESGRMDPDTGVKFVLMQAREGLKDVTVRQ